MTTAPGWRPTRPLRGRPTLALWLLCLASISGALVVEHASAVHVGEVSSVRVEPLALFLALVTARLWPPDPRRRTIATALTMLLALAIDGGTCWLLGEEPITAGRTAVAAVVQAGIALAVFRIGTGDDDLVPHRPRDLVTLAFAALLGSLVALPLGPAEGLSLAQSSVFDLVWWTSMSTSSIFVGGACLLLLFGRSPRTEAIPTRLVDVWVQMLVTGLCLAAVFAWVQHPLTWIVLLPAIWAGMTMGPWTAAAYSLTAALSVELVQAVPRGDGGPPGSLSDLLLLDNLLATFVFVVLLLSLLRDQRAYLSAEVVRRRQDSDEQAELLGTVFESISDAVVLIDPTGRTRLHNPAAVRLLGTDRLETEPAAWLSRLDEEPSFNYVHNAGDNEEGVRVLGVQLARAQYAGSDVVVAVARDVTSEQLRIEELTSFAAVAAHDLKGPLSAVQGWLEVAEDALGGPGGPAGTDRDIATEALERGRHATDRMSTEIDDWLTYNVAREGVVAPEPVVLQPVLESIVLMYPNGDFQIEAPDTVLADPTLLRHLLVNLIGNAVKYTFPGELPTITVRSFPSQDGRSVRIYVVDAGIGIPVGEESAIFEPFRRATGVSAEYDGSGLGLALAKRIVRRHGGMISAERNQGPGSTFTVILPKA